MFLFIKFKNWKKILRYVIKNCISLFFLQIIRIYLKIYFCLTITLEKHFKYVIFKLEKNFVGGLYES